MHSTAPLTPANPIPNIADIVAHVATLTGAPVQTSDHNPWHLVELLRIRTNTQQRRINELELPLKDVRTEVRVVGGLIDMLEKLKE